MTSTLSLDVVPEPASRTALAHDQLRSTDGLGEAIAELAARLHAATYELLVLLREFDEREIGAIVQRALEAAADRLFRESAGASSGGVMAEDVTSGQRRADALGLLAEAALAADLDRGTTGDRYQVVLHVEHTESAMPRPLDGAPLELADGATYVSAETSQRLACDASIIVMRHDGDGRVLDVGRKTRTVPPAIRRALQVRDRRCRFPGCTARRCDAHHVMHSTPARTARAPGTPAGRTAARPASRISCRCADAITARYTRADSGSPSIPMALSSFIVPMEKH